MKMKKEIQKVDFLLVFFLFVGVILYLGYMMYEDNRPISEEIINEEVTNILVENSFFNDTLIIYLKSGRVLETNNKELLHEIRIGEAYTFKIVEYKSGRISVKVE